MNTILSNSISAFFESPIVRAPIIIVGVGRSGTSILLESILQHQNVAGKKFAGENPFLGAYSEFINDFFYGSVDVEYRRVNNRLDEEPFHSLSALMLFLNSIGFDALKEMDGKKFWATKAFPTSNSFPTIKRFFPEARFIYIYRNGIEVVNSTVNYEGFDFLSFTDACSRWSASFGWYDFLRGQEKTAVLNYADMVRNPVEAFNHVFRDIDLNHTDVCANYVRDNKINSSYNNRVAYTPSQIFHDIWDQKMRDIFIERCGLQMTSHNFETYW